MGDEQGRVGVAEAGGRLEEEGGVRGRREVELLRVLAVVEADAADRAGLVRRERGEELRGGEGEGEGRGGGVEDGGGVEEADLYWVVGGERGADWWWCC